MDETRITHEARKQNEILQVIFERIPVMINFFGADGELKLINRQWEQTLGWSLDEIREQRIDIFEQCYPDPRSRQRVLDFVAANEKGWRDFKTRVRNGRVIDTSWAVVHLSDGTRIGIGIDTSERKRVEEDLKLRESQLAESQRLAHIGSWNWDVLSDTLTWSVELYRLFGFDPREFKPTHEIFLDELVHQDDRSMVIETLKNSLITKNSFGYEFRNLQPDGSIRVFHSHGRVVTDENGDAIRMFGTVQDVTERREAEEELRTSNESLRALSARLHSIREEEGARIAREIHDELGSALLSLKWDLEAAERIFSESEIPSSLLPVRAKLPGMVKTAEGIFTTVRRISAELRPRILDDLGLLAALEWESQQFEARTGIACRFACQLEDVPLKRAESTAVFRIVQEALTNVARHARATEVHLTTERENGDLILTVRDNGRGITAEELSEQRSLGILGMRERAQLIGGTIHIGPALPNGTVVTVRVAGVLTFR